jgi:PAT family acetyl-CoA transporter-like MFS transporter 1
MGDVEDKTVSAMTPEILDQAEPKANLRKDIKSILILFGLYILQGVPIGLLLTVPFLLQSKGVSYEEQAKFSLAFWPFSLKVFYAPIIDSIYYKRYIYLYLHNI